MDCPLELGNQGGLVLTQPTEFPVTRLPIPSVVFLRHHSPEKASINQLTETRGIIVLQKDPRRSATTARPNLPNWVAESPRNV